MRFTPWPIATLLVGPLLAAAPVDRDSWKAVAASGPVDYRVESSEETPTWERVRRGDLLAPFTELRTGSRGRATLSLHASLIVLDPDTQLVLPAAAGPGRAGAVLQEQGRVIYEVDGRHDRGFRVETPYLIAGVKGTVFLVHVGADRASVTVREGTVEITSRSGERLLLEAGETVLVRGSDGETEQVDHIRGTGGAERIETDRPVDRSAKHVAWLQTQRLEQAAIGRQFLPRRLLLDELRAARRDDEAGAPVIRSDKTGVVGAALDTKVLEELEEELIEELDQEVRETKEKLTPAHNPATR